MLTNTFFLKIGQDGILEKHNECAEVIRNVLTRTAVRAEVNVIPDGLNTCIRITVWVTNVAAFHMLVGSLTDWASAHYERAVLEIAN